MTGKCQIHPILLHVEIYDSHFARHDGMPVRKWREDEKQPIKSLIRSIGGGDITLNGSNSDVSELWVPSGVAVYTTLLLAISRIVKVNLPIFLLY